jgi:hypothetical protein
LVWKNKLLPPSVPIHVILAETSKNIKNKDITYSILIIMWQQTFKLVAGGSNIGLVQVNYNVGRLPTENRQGLMH